MRRALLAASSMALFLAGCANDLYPSMSKIIGAPARPAALEQAAADCRSEVPAQFGSDVHASSLTRAIAEPATSDTAQRCTWGKGTRVTYAPAALAAEAISQQR